MVLPSRKIHAVALAFENPQLEHTIADGLPITGQSKPQTIELNEYPRLRAPVPELGDPPVERHHTIRKAVLADFDHQRSVACGLRLVKPGKETWRGQ
jgi:hypothetical protein